MTAEQNHSSEQKGDQRTLIKDRIGMVGEAVAHRNKNNSFELMLYSHFDDLGIDWDIPRSQIQINTVVPSIFMASNVARYETTGQFHKDDEIETPDQCWDTMSKILEDPDSRNIFHEKLWLLPVTFIPERTNALYAITKHMLGGSSQKPLAMVDLGAGPGYALPLLNQGRDEDIEIACGISVDKLTREEAILLAKSNSRKETNRKNIDTFVQQLDPVKFPFVVADLEHMDDSHGKIVSKLAKYNRDKADVVFSSFVKYQLGLGNNMRELVDQVLDENGIWVDIGDELLHPTNSLYHQVHVYQKQRGELKHIGVPILIDDWGTIIKTNQDFFRAHGESQALT